VCLLRWNEGLQRLRAESKLVDVCVGFDGVGDARHHTDGKEAVVYLIRRAKVEDVSTLTKLARMVHFINLPPNKDMIGLKIAASRDSFRRAAAGSGKREDRPKRLHEPGEVRGYSEGVADSDVFMFVLENTETGSVLGTSQLIAQMGGPGNPNYGFKLERREFFADDIKTGTSHVVARLHADESGPTEIGGLILQPAARGARLGRLLSFIRFHFIGMRRELFADRVLAELMAPISDDGRSLFWEYVGQRFIPLSYTEADVQCGRSRQFIAALLPHEDIYLSLLPPEARDGVGEVHRETLPARRMLEKLGFKFCGVVDPFDAGPMLDAVTDDIPLLKLTSSREMAGVVEESVCDSEGIVSMMRKDGEFLAVFAPMKIDSKGLVSIPAAHAEAIGVRAGDELGVTDLTRGFAPTPTGGAAASGAKAEKVS